MTIDTCPKGEYLEIQKEIYNLALKVITLDEIKTADNISLDLTSSKERKRKARSQLKIIIGMKPYRPLFYANFHLNHLPRYTRDPIRYLGDYIDHLVKFWSSEINGVHFLIKSLGVNLKHLKRKINEDLRINLIDYNDLCYVPAKHDFKVIGKRRRFTCKEAVYISFITIALAKQIIQSSEKARKYSSEEINDDWSPMKDNSENKDIFYKE